MKTLDKIRIGVYTLLLVLLASLFVSCEKLGLGGDEPVDTEIKSFTNTNDFEKHLGWIMLKTTERTTLNTKTVINLREGADPNKEYLVEFKDHEDFDITVNGINYTEPIKIRSTVITTEYKLKDPNIPLDTIKRLFPRREVYYRGRQILFGRGLRIKAFSNLSPVLRTLSKKYFYNKGVEQSEIDISIHCFDGNHFWKGSIKDYEFYIDGKKIEVPLSSRQFLYYREYRTKIKDTLIFKTIATDNDGVKVELLDTLIHEPKINSE